MRVRKAGTISQLLRYICTFLKGDLKDDRKYELW